jgi:hypothetical protein
VSAVGRAAGRGVGGGVVELVQQLFHVHLRVLHQRLHGVHVLQGGVQVHRVVNLEDGFANVVATAGGAANHLLVKNARLDPAHEHQMADGRYVDAGGEQVHRDGNAGEALVLVAADELVYLVRRAGDLLHGGLVVLRAIDAFKRLAQQAHHHVGMRVGGAEDHGFFFAHRVQLLGQLLADDAVEVFVDDTAVEALHLKVQLVVQLGGFDLAGAEVQALHRVALGEVDAVFAEQGLVTDGRLVVDEPVVGHGFAVGVGVDRFAKNLAGVLGGRGR